MTRNAIEEAIQRKPFHPFNLVTVDGERLNVPAENYACVHPFAETMIVFISDGGHTILDLVFIAELEAA